MYVNQSFLLVHGSKNLKIMVLHQASVYCIDFIVPVLPNRYSAPSLRQLRYLPLSAVESVFYPGPDDF